MCLQNIDYEKTNYVANMSNVHAQKSIMKKSIFEQCGCKNIELEKAMTLPFHIRCICMHIAHICTEIVPNMYLDTVSRLSGCLSLSVSVLAYEVKAACILLHIYINPYQRYVESNFRQ